MSTVNDGQSLTYGISDQHVCTLNLTPAAFGARLPHVMNRHLSITSANTLACPTGMYPSLTSPHDFPHPSFHLHVGPQSHGACLCSCVWSCAQCCSVRVCLSACIAAYLCAFPPTPAMFFHAKSLPHAAELWCFQPGRQWPHGPTKDLFSQPRVNLGPRQELQWLIYDFTLTSAGRNVGPDG